MRLLVIAALVVALVPGATAGRRPDAALRIVDWTPLTVRGTGFAAGEQVRLTLRTGRPRTVSRTTRAGRSGTFRAAFGLLVALDPCRGTLVVTATGSRGSRATVKRPCRPPSTAPPRKG
jgi:hypothetical protein